MLPEQYGIVIFFLKCDLQNVLVSIYINYIKRNVDNNLLLLLFDDILY